MANYLYLRMAGCIKGEKIKFEFTGLEKMNLAILTEERFTQYDKDIKSVVRNRCLTNAVAEIDSDGVWYAVFDDDGAELKDVTGTVHRYSPLFTKDEVWNDTVPQGMSLVYNAKETEADGSMIQYWKEHQHKNSKINLNNKSFVCPSCGKRVSIDSLHGAHVVRMKGNGTTMYITPTCDSCNTSKTNRLFKVETIDLIVAPE